MPLLDFWKNSKQTVLGMSIAQIVGIAGDGVLKDASKSSNELRTFLSEVESEKLAEYATYCIENSFTNSGRVLQDVVNETGRRLGFKVENGRYQGVAGDIGFDGIWKGNDFSIVVEVKTTDVYTINLETL